MFSDKSIVKQKKFVISFGVILAYSYLYSRFKDGCMRKYLLRISLVATLLCGFLLTSLVREQEAIVVRQQDEKQIKRDNERIHHMAEEPESAPVSLLRPSLPSHRVASSRSVRLLPTHGGKPSQHSGRWVKGQLSHHSKYALLRPCIGHHQSCMVASSPRRYYVITLRRLLC